MREGSTLFSRLLHFTFDPYFLCWVLSKGASSTIFWVFGMTWHKIESQSPRPLVNTLLTRPMDWSICTVNNRNKKLNYPDNSFNEHQMGIIFVMDYLCIVSYNIKYSVCFQKVIKVKYSSHTRPELPSPSICPYTQISKFSFCILKLTVKKYLYNCRWN